MFLPNIPIPILIGVGVDNFDLDALKAAGIPLMNTPGVNARAVAELALGLILEYVPI